MPLAGQAVYSSQSQRHMEKESILHGQGRLCRYSRQLKLNSQFYKKKELEENSIYSFKPIRSTEKNSIGVSRSSTLSLLSS